MRINVAAGLLVTLAAIALSACVPAKQYAPLDLTILDTGQSRTVSVHSQGLWRDTGILLKQGEIYQVSTQGSWSASPFCGPTDAGGVVTEHLMCMKGLIAHSFPSPEARVGALVAKVGLDGRVFALGGTRSFTAERDGALYLRMNDPDGLMFDNEGELQVAIQNGVAGAPPPTIAAGGPGTTVASGSSPQPRVHGAGYYTAERDITFNVLERVEFDPDTGALSLSGRFDPGLAGPRIPYLQHLAEFLDNSGPQASLDWTPEFERRVDSFFSEMDDSEAMARLVGSGQLVDDNFNVTRKGRLFLPIFGVKPFDFGNAPGYLGVSTSFKELGTVRVDSVAAGSAADRAGIRAGDDITFLEMKGSFKQPFVPDMLNRYVRFAGAGAEVKVSLTSAGQDRNVDVILDAYTGDPWEHVTKYDMLQRIFRAADKPQAATLMRVVGELIRYNDTEAGQIVFINLLAGTGASELFYANRERVNRGEMTQNAAMHEVSRKMVRGMEEAMELPYDSIVSIYDREYARTGDPFGPIDVAILELNRRAAPMMKESLRTALYKNDQITLPVAVLDESRDFRPQVRPRYIGVPATSELARLFIEADYVGKAIIHRPELSKRIPAYKTEYAFTGERPGRVEETTNRLWIAPARVDVRRSTSQNTLAFGDVQMKINIGRAIGGGAEHRDDAYGRFLSNLYPDLAREFPALHELREAAKIAIVARWLKARQPGFTLPREGRARLTPPDTMEGFVTLIWSPHSVKVSLIAPGGIDFNVPPIGPSGPVFPNDITVNVPVDGSVVDMRDLGETALPTVDPQAFAPGSTSAIPPSYRRPLTEPPVPASLRLVARATKGQRTLERIDGLMTQTRIDANRCDVEKSRELAAKLGEAAGIARQLRGAKKALNAITAQAAERQRTFTEIEQTLREEEQRLRETMMDLATGGLLDAYDELKGSVNVRSIKDLEDAIALMRTAKDKLGDYSGKLADLDLALSSAMARTLNEREQATKNLLGFLKDTLGEGADLMGNDAATRALRTAGKTLKVVDEVQKGLDAAESLYKINAAVERLQSMDELSERELQGLSDGLLPFKDKLSRKLDTAMKDPLIQAYEAGGGRFDCGG